MKEDLASDLLHAIVKTQRAMAHRTKQLAYQYDLSMPQFFVLKLLNRQKILKQKKLQKQTHLPKSTLSYVLDNLVEKEFVKREISSESRRETIIVLTEAGQAFVDKIKSDDMGVEASVRKIVQQFKSEQVEEIIKFHQLMIESLDESGGHL